MSGGGVWDRTAEDLDVSGSVKVLEGIRKDFRVRDEHLGFGVSGKYFGCTSENLGVLDLGRSAGLR